jgi:1,4-dihydroxy-2-naphthoate polyprenyltransferase
MTKSQAWIKALRFRTLPLSLSGIILGSFIALFHGVWDTAVFALAMCTTILFQMLSNLANDLGDSQKGADNDQRVGPIRAVQSGVISIKEMKIAVVLTAVLSLAVAIPLIYIGTQNLPGNILGVYTGLAILCVVAAITYTVGKKAYGYSGFGDFFVFVFFGFVSVLGVYSLHTKSFNVELLLPATSMRDVVNDEKVGKRTLVVTMGAKKAKLYHFFLVLGGLFSLAVFIGLQNNPIAFLGMCPSILILRHLWTVWFVHDPREFDPELKKVALATFAIALLTSAFLNFSLFY